MKKQILVDVDGCILDWLSTFVEYMQDEGYSTHSDEPDQYDLESFFNIPRDEVLDRIQQFNDGHWRFGTLKPYEDAIEAMSLLSKLGYSFVAVTSCSAEPEVANLRKANLYNVYGDIFKTVHCIGLHANKTELLRQYSPTFWIEDRTPHAIEGAKAGHKAILIDRPWNQGEGDNTIQRCMNWAEIVEYIFKNSSI